MRTVSAIGCSAALIVSLGLGKAAAQIGQGLSDQELIDPWVRARAVVLSLTPFFDTTAVDDRRGRSDVDLRKLVDELSKLQVELENAAIRIAAVPEFTYVAANKSSELATQVLDVKQSFDALFGKLEIRERPDVRAMQGSLDSLQQILYKQDRFEQDVVRAIASGGRNEIQALAGQWWRVGEAVEGVKLAVLALRPQATAAPDSERKKQ
jgi:hypothetical protein